MDAHKIFISYSLTDSEFALKLASDLRNSGANIWFDQLDIRRGYLFECMLVIVSSASVSSDNVLDAIKYALAKKKRVIPIVINHCNIPYRIKRLQHIDFRSNYIEGFNSLLEELNLDDGQQKFNPPASFPSSSFNLKRNKFVSHYAAGTIVGFVSILLLFAYYFAGLSYENSHSWMPLITMVLIILFILCYGKVGSNDYNLSYGNLFKYGFKTTAIFALLMTIFFLLILYFFPDYKEMFMGQMNNQTDQQVNLSYEQNKGFWKSKEIFLNIFLVGRSLFQNIMYGTIASLIGSTVAQKAFQSRQQRLEMSGLFTSDILQVSDVSRVILLRKRLRRAAFSMKVIGIIFAFMVGDFNNAYSLVVTLVFGFVLLWFIFRVCIRLKSGKTYAAIFVGLSVVLYLAWFLFGNLRWALKVEIDPNDFPTLFNVFMGLAFTYIPAYFIIRGLLDLYIYKSGPINNPDKFAPLTLNPWEDGRKGARKHPIFVNKSNLKAYGVILLAPLLWLFASEVTSMYYHNKPLSSIWQVTISIIVWLWMIRLYRRGRRYAMLPGNKLLKNDNRDIVLYLRSFIDDSSIKLRAPAHNGRILPERLVKITFEELITDHLWRYGPVVAFGNPDIKGKLAPLGAARDFERHDDWQEKITDLMQKASIIAAVISQTEGFIWEINTIIKLGIKSKLVLLLPPVQTQDLTGRWDSLVHHIRGVKLPQKIDLVHTRAVIFTEDQVVLITADYRNGSTYETVLDNAAELILAR